MMFEYKLMLKSIACALLCVVASSACARHGNSKISSVQGTVPLETLKVGMPEAVFKNAMLTFYTDRNPASTVVNKTQYDSRTYNSKGGQYLAQCRGDKCFELQVYYMSNPVSKEDALETMNQMLPGDAQPQTRVDDSQLKSASIDQPVETYYFGAYRGELQYTDKSANKVKIVNVVDLKGESSHYQEASSDPTPGT